MKSKLANTFIRFFSFPRRLLGFFLLISAGLITLLIFFYHTKQAIQSTSYWLKHSQIVIDNISLVSLVTTDLQWENRNYIRTGDTSALHAYWGTRKTLDSGTAYLVELT